MSSNTYCKYPFTAIAMKNFTNGNLQAVWPCCSMGNAIEPYGVPQNFNRLDINDAHLLTPQELFNHPRMDQLRTNILAGERDSACKVCWDQEDRGLKSAREFSYIDNDDITYISNLEEIDITLSNICNLRCRMCSPNASNLLMVDHQYFKKNNLLEKAEVAISGRWVPSVPHSTRHSLQLEWLLNNTDKIKTLKASGGEPFYDKKILELLEVYVAKGHAKNTSLMFHTNATQFTNNVIELLSNFKLNNHTLSIDGTDRIYEYIRYPATFVELNTNLDNYFSKLQNKPEFTHFAMVVSALNVLNIPEYIKWTTRFDTISFVDFQELHPLDRGTSLLHLPVHILSTAKERVLPYLNASADNSRLNSLITQIDNAIINNRENKQLMLDEITIFDLSRNQSYRDHLDPILVEWLDSE
jgi:MoaA/NifB/PqqE/SkfB family radical SAM enzyme